jgi:hypothetical protein
MLYFFLSDSISINGILYIILMIFGNAIGAVFLNLMEARLKNKGKKTESLK